MRFHAEVDRPNLYVKIPATKPGLAAIEDCIARGKSINVTLIFSLQRYAEVVEAYLRGLERLVAAGGDPSRPSSPSRASSSRASTRRRTSGSSSSGGRTSPAGSRSRTRSSRTSTTWRPFSGPRWEFLWGKGARPQRCLWASTSTKNPAYRDVLYVEELIGPNTVNTMPAETIRAFQDHGEVRGDTLLEGVDEANVLIDELAAAGVDYDDVVETLENGRRGEVRRFVPRADGGHPGQAGRARPCMTENLVRPDLGAGRERLDRPRRGRVARLARRARPRARARRGAARGGRRLPDHDDVVLLGMGGSSLAPEVFRRAFDATPLPRPRHDASAASGGWRSQLDLGRTLFLVSSKSGGTVETISHFEFFYEASGRDGGRFAVITDPGSPLERLADERELAAVLNGVPSIGGRYSALSPFGLVPAALMGVDLERLLTRALEAAEACRLPGEGNPGLELGMALGEGWREASDKIVLRSRRSGSASGPSSSSPSRRGRTARGSSRRRRARRRARTVSGATCACPTPYELGQEIFRWEFATAVAGHLLGIDPFDQPDVQAAKDRTGEVLERRRRSARARGLAGRTARRRRSRRDYVAIQAFVDPAREGRPGPGWSSGRARRAASSRSGSGRATCTRPVSCTRAGRTSVLCVQVVDDPGDELPIPGKAVRLRAPDPRPGRRRSRCPARARTHGLRASHSRR